MNIYEIKKFFEVIKDNDQLTEIRILGDKKTFSGYFADSDSIIKEIANYENFNIYFTLNKINEACASRTQSNHIIPNPKTTTSDNDIISREWVLIDLDPKRPADTNATDEEKIKAQSVVNRIYGFLQNAGFSNPIVADSSNGYHLLYKVMMNNNPEKNELVKKFLNTLAIMFSTEEVEVDTSVFNPSRICKLYGTTSRKGSNTKERPQRESKILRIPKEVKVTPIVLFEKVVAMIPEPEKPTYQNNYNPVFNIDEFIHRSGIKVEREIQIGGARKLLLKECPFDSNHKSPDSAIFILPNGAIGFKCFHNSCSSHSWADLRALYEPKRETYRTVQPTRSMPQQEDNRGSKFLNLYEIEAIDRSAIVSIPSGIVELDNRIVGFNLGEVSLWSGNNASGKSTLLQQFALNAAQSGFMTALFSGELTPNRVKQWIHQQAAGRQYTQKSGYADSYYCPKSCGEQIDGWLKDKLFIYNNKYGNKIVPLLEDMKEIVKRGVKCIVLDNLMSIDILEMEGDKYSKQTSLILMLCNFAKDYNVHIHIVAHPRKATGFLRKTDVSGTADLTNAVDNVFIIHRVNNDFKTNAKDFFTVEVASRYFGFGNVIEVCKNRDLGVMDFLSGVFYEIESRRFLNFAYENINYGWIPTQSNLDFEDMPDF